MNERNELTDINHVEFGELLADEFHVSLEFVFSEVPASALS